jgi:antitoxin component YwqK of YwqJK toxin-antitoxin module
VKFLAWILLALAGTALSYGTLRTGDEARTSRIQTSYYANGQIETQSEVHDGQREGISRRFYPDGTPSAEGRYAEGKMDGEWTFWHRDGSRDTERSGTYAAGAKVGG